MKKAAALILAAIMVVSLVLIIGALLTWWGHVLLPEMGLTAPGYVTWVQSLLPLTVLSAVVVIVRNALKAAGD